MLSLLVFALAPPTEPGVWLRSPPKPGTVVTAPLDIAGETQALEGVLRVDLFVVNGATVRLVSTYKPAVPLGSVPFEFRWDPASTPSGTVTLRVVASTLLRGFSAEAPGLVVPAAPATRGTPRVVATARAAAPARVPARAVAPTGRRLDDSGRAFGPVAPVLPYAPPTTPPPRPPTLSPVPGAARPFPPDRSGWASVAGGLLLLVVCAHLHRLLRPDPMDGR